MTGLALATAILNMLPALVSVLDKLLKGITKDKLDAFLRELETTMDLIAKAETEKERRDAARAFVKTVSRIP